MGSVLMVPPGSPSREALPTSGHHKAFTDHKVLSVILGNIAFKTWYPSFYPEELIGKDVDRLYICQWCFKYSKEIAPFVAHMVNNTLLDLVEKVDGSHVKNLQKLCGGRDTRPPGKLIYSKGPHTIYEVDGEEHKLFTQNLSLFAKLFLDNKSVFYDVSTFNYYLLVRTLPSTPSQPPSFQIVGFFSKEKMSWDNNNLACILIFPPWQRRGLGKILMGVSYELSRREGRIGGPEKPLSELGRKGYIRFWGAAIARIIIGNKAKTNMTLGEVAKACWVLPEDVLAALKEMDVLAAKRRADGSVVVNKAKVREWVRASMVDLTTPVLETDIILDWPGEDAMYGKG